MKEYGHCKVAVKSVESHAVEYLAVVRRYGRFVNVLSKTGWVIPVSNEALAKSTRVPWRTGEEVRDLTGSVLGYRSYIRSGKPWHYIGVIGVGTKNTHVVLPDFRELYIPNEELGNWIHVDETFYRVWEAMREPYTRDLGELTFGIEFEFCGSKALRPEFVQAMTELVGESRFSDDGEADGNVWNLDHDSSIRTGAGEYGYELQSPILHYGNPKDYEELCAVLGLVKTVLHGRVNASCGTHIHFGGFVKSFGEEWQQSTAASALERHLDDVVENRALFKEFSLCYGKWEKAVFDRLVAMGRRADQNEYCHSCCAWKDSRYRKINLQCYDNNKTLENRHHQGTLDAEEIWHWMELNGRFLQAFLCSRDKLDRAESMADFFDAIGLEASTRSYYLRWMEVQREEDRRQIEAMMQSSDYRSGEDRFVAPVREIVLQQRERMRACA